MVEDERCRVEELEINLMRFGTIRLVADEETVWRAVTALTPSRVHCAFDEFERGFQCLRSRCLLNAQHVVVEGCMRAAEPVLRYVMTERNGSLCWLSNEENPADGSYLVEVIIQAFQAQTEMGSFGHVLFLQYPYPPTGWNSEAVRIEDCLGLVPMEDNINFRNIARFYPDSTTSFDKHVMRVSDEYKAFALENASGHRIFVVASDDDASMMDGNYWLQRVAFVPDLSILRD